MSYWANFAKSGWVPHDFVLVITSTFHQEPFVDWIWSLDGHVLASPHSSQERDPYSQCGAQRHPWGPQSPEMCLLEKVSSATGYALFWDRQLSQPWQSHNLPATRHTLVCHQKRYFTRETRHDGVTHCRIWTFYHCICLTRCKNIFYGDIGCDKSMFKPAKNAPATAVRNDGDQRLLILTSNKVKLKRAKVERYFYSAGQCWGQAPLWLWRTLLL